MIARSEQIIPMTPAADHREHEGKFVVVVDGTAAVTTSATTAPFGVIVEGGRTISKSSIALPGFGGTVPVKVTGTSPGTIGIGTKLTVNNDGTVQADAGSGARVIVAEALESGAANELIEARLLEPQVFAGGGG